MDSSWYIALAKYHHGDISRPYTQQSAKKVGDQVSKNVTTMQVCRESLIMTDV